MSSISEFNIVEVLVLFVRLFTTSRCVSAVMVAVIDAGHHLIQVRKSILRAHCFAQDVAAASNGKILVALGKLASTVSTRPQRFRLTISSHSVVAVLTPR